MKTLLGLNWKTNAAGWLLLITFIIHIAYAVTHHALSEISEEQWTAMITELVGSFLGFSAKDSNVTGGSKGQTPEAETRTKNTF